MKDARSALMPLSVIFAVLLLPQFYLAGAATFGATSFDAHVGLGYALLALSLALVVVAVASRTLVALTALLLGLMVLQVVLAQAGEGSGWIGGLHAVNALAIFAVAGLIGHRAGMRAKGLGEPEPTRRFDRPPAG
ncbi:MAG: hypothetical protein QOD86_747 [Miltoncostaeaceae bacterium]|jgi:hypothetical protein|nr:hypothetical protein [Miltoncostaeaceae bacterium]